MTITTVYIVDSTAAAAICFSLLHLTQMTAYKPIGTRTIIDRWLCTLLLQQGWKIDYAAGADAFTFAPETFTDFYIQRRRWAPSTLANIIDLLS
jgi:hypothetical protein